MAKRHYSLLGKTVLLTGGGRGLGAATAAELIHRGARVTLADIDEATAQETAARLPSGQALAVACDVTDPASLAAAVKQTEEHFGLIDIAIANAGLMGHGATMRNQSAADLGRVMAVNVAGAANTVSATVDSVIKSRGQIVVISSVFAYLNGAGAIPYAMSKAAVEQLGRGLNVELAGHGASAMTAYFSMIDTDMIRAGVDADPHVVALLSAMPKFVSARIQPETAAKAIADGLERRRPTIAIPSRWRPIGALRGILGPVSDARLARDASVRRALCELDAR